MSQELPIRGGSSFPKRKLLLVILIVCLGVIIYSVLDRLHHIVESSFGNELAVVIVAGVTIGILFLILVGMGLGGVLEWAVCRRFLIFKRKPLPGGRLEFFLKLWGHKFEEIPESQPAKASSDEMPPGITLTDIEELLVITGQRRRGGKKSLHPDDTQFRAVRDWMIMQSRGTSVTLQQFLEERFGTAPETGMPLVPNQTFYGWRTKFLKELKKYKHAQSKRK
jgi:hypothetical protein